jgi:hypothetical protein
VRPASVRYGDVACASVLTLDSRSALLATETDPTWSVCGRRCAPEGWLDRGGRFRFRRQPQAQASGMRVAPRRELAPTGVTPGHGTSACRHRGERSLVTARLALLVAAREIREGSAEHVFEACGWRLREPEAEPGAVAHRQLPRIARRPRGDVPTSVVGGHRSRPLLMRTQPAWSVCGRGAHATDR